MVFLFSSCLNCVAQHATAQCKIWFKLFELQPHQISHFVLPNYMDTHAKMTGDYWNQNKYCGMVAVLKLLYMLTRFASFCCANLVFMFACKLNIKRPFKMQ